MVFATALRFSRSELATALNYSLRHSNFMLGNTTAGNAMNRRFDWSVLRNGSRALGLLLPYSDLLEHFTSFCRW